MFRGDVGNVLLAPVSELLSRLLVQINETVHAARDVLIEKESFTQLSGYLEKITPILGELQKKGFTETATMREALQLLEKELKNAKELIDTCSSKSKFYLLVHCRLFVKQVQEITNEVGRALSLIPLTTLDISLETQEKTAILCKEMQVAHFKAAAAEEEIMNKIETGVRDRRKSSNYSNDLLAQIARAVGVPVDPSSLKQELDEFKKEQEAAQLQKKHAEALQLEQMISLLNWADAAFSATEREREYKKKRVTLGTYSLSPLQTFFCPITQDVMEDPVEVSTGQTFERSAIEKWFSEGQKVCPVTKEELENLRLRPNIMLKRSIEEWRDRNTMIKISSMRAKLESEDEEAVIGALSELQALSEEKSVHRHWIAAEGLISVVVEVLRSGKRNVRKRTLATLCTLVKNSNDNRGKVSEAGAVDIAVRSLARELGEARHAVAFLLEMSKDEKLRDQISKVQGCILLLVTMTNSENQQAAEDARELLENLSDQEQNVVMMAEANYFKPLVQRLIEGPNLTQVLMANELSRMALTDQSRAVLVHEGVLTPLVTMVSAGNVEAKPAALGALRNLSSLPENAHHMVKAGVVHPLLDLLFTVRSVVMTFREHAAETFANLATASTSTDVARDLLRNLTESGETVYEILSLLNLTGPTIQGHLLRALTGICCQPAATEVRTMMRDGGAIQLVVPFCEANDGEVRINAMKLLCCLAQDGDTEALAEAMEPKYIQNLVNLLKSSSKEEEKAAAMGIFGNLSIPDNKQITEIMLQAGALSAIIATLARCIRAPGNATRSQLLENTTWALIRFTLPTNLLLQKHTAENDVIPLLVHLLSSGTPLTKCRAAVSLGQFSESTIKLCIPVKRPRSWWCFPSPPVKGCSIHGGICSITGSFCLLEAEAISPLVQTLEEHEGGADEAALGALLTLLYDECWVNGAQAIAEAQGIRPIVRLLTSGTEGVQKKALLILERIFRNEKYRSEYGNAAQMALIALTQDGTNATRPLAAKILAHLNILHDQSSYF